MRRNRDDPVLMEEKLRELPLTSFESVASLMMGIHPLKVATWKSAM